MKEHEKELNNLSLDELIEYYRNLKNDDDDGSSGTGSGSRSGGGSDNPDPPCKERDYPRDNR